MHVFGATAIASSQSSGINIEMKMDGNCAKELLLLILFAMTYSSLGSKCEEWVELPLYVPELPEAQEEYCDLFQKLELSRTQLNDAIKEWAKKYNVSVNINSLHKMKDMLSAVKQITMHHIRGNRGFSTGIVDGDESKLKQEDCNKDLAREARFEDTFHEILKNIATYNDTANKVVKEIVDLMGDKNSPMRIIYFKIYQILYALPKEEMVKDIHLWSKIYKRAEDEWLSQFGTGNLEFDTNNEMARGRDGDGLKALLK
uniref:DUF148 domain-containing protein n=1 Tax=Elaeophora elaphi TaxID=1147741 RepID=A0A0R3RK28_9BILA